MRPVNFLKDMIQLIQKYTVDYSIPLGIFAVSRFSLFFVVYLSLIFLPIRNEPDLIIWRPYPENLFLDGWSRWDSGWYRAIAEQGYTNKVTPFGQDTAFFPLYPILIKLLNYIINDTNLAGIIISNIAYLFSLIFLFKLIIKLNYDVEISRRCLLLISFSPFSFYFSSIYSESIFMLTVVCAFYFCECKKYVIASLFAAAAGATRTTGILIIFGLIIMYLEQINFNFREIKLNILWLLLCLIGPFSYFVFLFVQFGSPLQFITSQSAWGSLNSINIISESILHSMSFEKIIAGNYPAMNIFHISIFIFSVILCIIGFLKLKISYSVWSILTLLSYYTRILGVGRYALVVFPLFILIVVLCKKDFYYDLLLYLNIMLLTLFSIMFSHWYWVA